MLVVIKNRGSPGKVPTANVPVSPRHLVGAEGDWDNLVPKYKPGAGVEPA